MSDDEIDPLEPDDEDAERTEPEPGTPDSAADKRRLKQQQRRQELDDREAEDWWRATFASPVGRREMWGLLKAAGIMDPRFGAGPNGFPDAHASFFRAGIKSVSDHYLDQRTIRDFEGVRLMRIEHDPRFPKPRPDKAKR